MDAGGAEQDSRRRPVDGADQPHRAGPGRPGRVGALLGVGRLEAAQIVHVVEEQAPLAHEPDLIAGLLVGGAVGDDGVMHLVGDCDAGRAGPEDHHALVLHGDPGDAGGGVHGGQHHRSGALQVVVEDAVAGAVGLQDIPRRSGPEVLEVQQRAGEHLRRSPDIALDERLVVLAANPGMPVAQVERVAEQHLVVGSDIERHRDDPVRANASAGGVDG